MNSNALYYHRRGYEKLDKVRLRKGKTVVLNWLIQNATKRVIGDMSCASSGLLLLLLLLFFFFWSSSSDDVDIRAKSSHDSNSQIQKNPSKFYIVLVNPQNTCIGQSKTFLQMSSVFESIVLQMIKRSPILKVPLSVFMSLFSETRNLLQWNSDSIFHNPRRFFFVENICMLNKNLLLIFQWNFFFCPFSSRNCFLL